MARKQPWQAFEEKVAKEHRGAHDGRPGKPDYRRGETQGEVKMHKKPLTKSQVMEECQKGRTEIVSHKGFTNRAKEYQKRYRPKVKLIHRKKAKSNRSQFYLFW